MKFPASSDRLIRSRPTRPFSCAHARCGSPARERGRGLSMCVPGQGECCDGTRPHLNCCSMRASNAGATLNEPARFTEAVLFEPTAWKSCEGYVYGDRHSASPATAAPPPSLPLPLSHRSRRHPAEPTRLAGSPSRMERQRRSGLWLGAWECRRQHAQRSMPGAAPSVPTTFVDEGGRWPIATIVTKCSLTGRSPSCLGWLGLWPRRLHCRN